eukprot:SAG11_NODE_22304_length_408_cov_1.087379_1_plen_34_part_10
MVTTYLYPRYEYRSVLFIWIYDIVCTGKVTTIS